MLYNTTILSRRRLFRRARPTAARIPEPGLMPAPLDVACPNCKKGLKVPPEFAGKTIRCKNCQTAFKVPTPAAPTPARPVAARPAAARPAAPADPNAPIPFKDDDPPPKAPPQADEEEETVAGQPARPYGVIKGDENVRHCPFCALPLDPPDTRICMHCGFDMLARKRHETRAVYETTTGDYILHWLPAIACILAIGVLVTISVICGLNMRDWLTGTFLDSEEKNEITGKTKFYIDPLCFNLFVWVTSAWLSFLAGRFAIRRLVINWRPPEVLKKPSAV
jgi:hypothetical protein